MRGVKKASPGEIVTVTRALKYAIDVADGKSRDADDEVMPWSTQGEELLINATARQQLIPPLLPMRAMEEENYVFYQLYVDVPKDRQEIAVREQHQEAGKARREFITNEIGLKIKEVTKLLKEEAGIGVHEDRLSAHSPYSVTNRTHPYVQ